MSTTIQTIDLFGASADKPKKTRSTRRVMAHHYDAGIGHPNKAVFSCKTCGWDSGWMDGVTYEELRKGIPCKLCNKGGERNIKLPKHIFIPIVSTIKTWRGILCHTLSLESILFYSTKPIDSLRALQTGLYNHPRIAEELDLEYSLVFGFSEYFIHSFSFKNYPQKLEVLRNHKKYTQPKPAKTTYRKPTQKDLKVIAKLLKKGIAIDAISSGIHPHEVIGDLQATLRMIKSQLENGHIYFGDEE